MPQLREADATEYCAVRTQRPVYATPYAMPNTNTPSTLLLLPGLSGRPKSLFFRSFNQPMVTLHETRQLQPSSRRGEPRADGQSRHRWQCQGRVPENHGPPPLGSAADMRPYSCFVLRASSVVLFCHPVPVYLPLAELNCGPGVAEAVEDLWIIPRHSDSSYRTIMMRPSGRQNGFTPQEYPELLQELLSRPKALFFFPNAVLFT